ADLPAALMTTVALYYFWRFLKLGGTGRAFLSAGTLGLSQLAKYSCIYLYPIFLLIAAIYHRSSPASAGAGPNRWQHLLPAVRRSSLMIILFAAVNIV